MFRKARADTKKENDLENEESYQKRVTQMDKKESGKVESGKVETVQEGWLGGMKSHNLDDN